MEKCDGSPFEITFEFHLLSVKLRKIGNSKRIILINTSKYNNQDSYIVCFVFHCHIYKIKVITNWSF